MGVTVTDKSSLCFSCHYRNHIISGKGSSFLQCQKHFENPRYPKYPVLPVLAVQDIKSRYSGALPMATKSIPFEPFLTEPDSDTP